MNDASGVPSGASASESDAKNHRAAELNRTRFAAEGTFVVSLGSAPGSGTTTLLVRTLEALKARGQTLAVIAGDQPATLGAVPADVSSTGADRRLDAEAIAQALVTHPAPLGGTLFIERGQAPELDLGEAKRVVVTAVSERSELSIKDRDVFAAADAVLVNKIDLVSTLGFDAVALERNVRSVNPTARVFQVSGRTGAGFDAWVSWLEESRTREFTAMASPV